MRIRLTLDITRSEAPQVHQDAPQVDEKGGAIWESKPYAGGDPELHIGFRSSGTEWPDDRKGRP